MSQTERIALPYKLSLDSLNKILIGYLRNGADERAVNYKNAAHTSGVHPLNVSRNNGFFDYAGFLTREKRGSFRLTEEGAKYARLLDWGRLEESRQPLRDILTTCPLLKQSLDYVDIRGGVSREDLVSRIANLGNVTRTDPIERGIEALVNMFLFSGLVEEKDGKLIYVKPTEEKKIEVPLRKEKPPEKKTTTPLIPINLTINVTDMTDLDKLKEVLGVIKKVLQEE